MRNVRIGTVSFLVDDTPHSIEKNMERACRYIAQAGAEGCDIVVLPEMFRTINVPEQEYDAALYPGPVFDRLAEAARSANLNLVATMFTAVDDRIYNQATVFDRTGAIVGHYRKVQPTGGEANVVTAGSELPVFALDIGRIAVMICMDIYFPEIPRIYAHKGAEILFWPTVSHGPTQQGLSAQLVSRAIDNSLVVVESNMAGHPPYAPYSGRYRPGTARIIDHNGDLLAQTGRRHGIAFCDVNLDEVRLTSWCVLLREPDHFREDLEAITRLDLYAREYARLASAGTRNTLYFSKTDDPIV